MRDRKRLTLGVENTTQLPTAFIERRTPRPSSGKPLSGSQPIYVASGRQFRGAHLESGCGTLSHSAARRDSD